MTKELIVSVSAVLSTVLAMSGSIPYIRTILKGQSKPHRAAWLVFTVMNGIVVVSQYLKGGRASVLVAAVYFVSSLIIYLLSFRYGVNNTSAWDRLLFGLSLLTIVAWILTSNPSIAIWLTVVIDVFATAMIILKLKEQPTSEALYPWMIGTSSFIFSTLTLVDKPFGILYVRPIYGFLSDGAVVVAIMIYGKASKRAAVTTSPAIQ